MEGSVKAIRASDDCYPRHRNGAPIQIGELLRELFILREDGTVDLDMLAAHLDAEELHGNEN